MKKKIIISISFILLAVIIGIGIGFLTGEKQHKTMEDPMQLIYYSDTEKTEGFKIDIPKEYANKVYVNISEPIEGLQGYAFTHESSKEVLFIIYISKGETYKQLSGKYEVMKTTDNYTYIWTQNVTKNEHILDETVRNEFEEIAKYYNVIKKSFEIKED